MSWSITPSKLRDDDLLWYILSFEEAGDTESLVYECLLEELDRRTV